MSDIQKIKRAAKKKPYVPSSDDPRAELRRIVNEHKALTKAQTAILNMSRDRKNRETGETIACRLPLDAQLELQAVAKAQSGKAAKLETAMLRELRKVPIYQHFLKHVFGIGPVIAAYLVAMIEIQKATKPSNLRRFCGLAVINGRLERPTKGATLGYCSEIRMRLYQAMTAMRMNQCHGTNKYMTIWNDYKHRMAHSARYDAEANTLLPFEVEEGTTAIPRKGAKAVIDATGWHKAADVFVEDLYTIWRTLEGLPVWPSYHAAKLGYSHGGTICVNEPKMLTLDEALATVGDVGKQPHAMAAE